MQHCQTLRSLPPCAFRSDYCYFRGRIRSQCPQGHAADLPTLWISMSTLRIRISDFLLHFRGIARVPFLTRQFTRFQARSNNNISASLTALNSKISS